MQVCNVEKPLIEMILVEIAIRLFEEALVMTAQKM